MGLGKVTHVTVYVKDQQASLDFYTGTLGFDTVADMSTAMGDYKMRWVTVRPKGGDGPEIALWPADQTPGGHGDKVLGGPTGITLVCTDLDATFDELSGKGVTITMPPSDVPWGRHGMFADNDGNQIYVVQPGGQTGG
jgi:catechol 2,3-dioxygenase-like lactoylglutathione lyase family enzyme